MEGLTPKRERFAREYAVDHNATRAAIRAGYAEGCAHVTGHRLITDANVRARVAELEGEALERLEIDQDAVIGMLVDAYRRAEELGQAGPMVRAAELLGKRHGMFLDRSREEGPEQRMAPEELADAIAGILPADLQEPVRRAVIDKIGNLPEPPQTQ